MTVRLTTFVSKLVAEMNWGPPMGIISLSVEVSTNWDFSKNMAKFTQVSIIFLCLVNLCLMSRVWISESLGLTSSKVCHISLFSCLISYLNMSSSTSFSLSFTRHHPSNEIKASYFLLDVGVVGKKTVGSASHSSI